MAYQVVICDDQMQDRDHVHTLVSQWAVERGISLDVTLFSSAEALLMQNAQQQCDILLLDIEMGQMDGVSLAKTIRQTNQSVQIIFITGYSDYIAEGYEVAALHYLMKPLQQEKLFPVLDRAVEKCKREERCLNLVLSGEILRIPFYDIAYLDVHQNYATVHTLSHPDSSEYTVKRTLSELAMQLDDRFCRVGRSLLVNLHCIRRVTRTQVLLSGDIALPLPRGAYEALNRAIIERT